MHVMLTTKKRIEVRRELETLCLLADLLPVHKRILIHLRYRDGYTYAEIAQVVMRSPETVARRVEAARLECVALRAGAPATKKRIVKGAEPCSMDLPTSSVSSESVTRPPGPLAGMAGAVSA